MTHDLNGWSMCRERIYVKALGGEDKWMFLKSTLLFCLTGVDPNSFFHQGALAHTLNVVFPCLPVINILGILRTDCSSVS